MSACRYCKTELIVDEVRGCFYCPKCHPVTGIKETPEQEAARLTARLAELNKKEPIPEPERPKIDVQEEDPEPEEYVEPVPAGVSPQSERESVIKQLNDRGIKFHHKCSLKTLKKLLAKQVTAERAVNQ